MADPTGLLSKEIGDLIVESIKAAVVGIGALVAPPEPPPAVVAPAPRECRDDGVLTLSKVPVRGVAVALYPAGAPWRLLGRGALAGATRA